MSNATLDVVSTGPQVEGASRPKYETLLAAAYGIALLVSLSEWLLAVRAPLWNDETLSYWQIAGGFKQIWTRSVQGNSFAAYPYMLWLTKTLFGDTELVLRIPSMIAMLAAIYVFYRCAREMFDWDISLLATILATLPSRIVYAAIDVRPYAFAMLLTNLAIFMFLRWMRTNKIQFAALFGVTAAGIFYFHYLFGSILLAFAVGYLLTRYSSLLSDWRQIGAALACFAIFIIPVWPQLGYMYRTRATHVFTEAPRWVSLLQTLNPGTWQLLALASALVLAALAQRLLTPNREMYANLLLCVPLALVPILCLYTISVTTQVHIFIPRYLLEATPGLALCWGWICSLIDSRPLRGLFCFVFVALCVHEAYTAPAARIHGFSWKYALEYADANAAADHASLLMCSPFVEGDTQPMPAVASESMLYAPLSYYKVKAPVVPLPGSLVAETERQAKQFLLKAALEHRRFLVLAAGPSLPTVDYLASYSSGTHMPRVLGEFDHIWIVEFVPYSAAR